MPKADDIAVVIPAYNAAGFLERSLPAALEAAAGAVVLVVDAGSTDSTGALAEALGARVLELGRRAGPAEARNAGAWAVDAGVMLFLDADCVPHRDVAERVVRAFTEEPTLVALSGSYDQDPAEQSFFSQYMNLRHHFTHQRARREGATFWAGLGAVRREVFLEVGGFDAGRYPRPAIEDIELGLRLREHGAMRLDPALQATHLKRWTLRSVIEVDIRCRAIPWSRLIVERGEIPADLNLRWSQRVASLFALLALAALGVAPVAAWASLPVLLLLCAACLSISIALNAPMLLFFARRRGLAFALGGWLFHQLHLTYSAATFLAVSIGARLGRLRRRAR